MWTLPSGYAPSTVGTPRYDRQTAWYDRVLLGAGRAWACSQSLGAVLEVAIGTGRNLPVQRRIEKRLLAVAGDHQTRQPRPLLVEAGFVIERDERSRLGIIQRLSATKPD
jgi:hypothetical protein